MKNKCSQHNWIIDLALFAGLVLMFFLDLTGEALHQWLGVALGGLALYHLLRHWGWAQSVTKRLFGKTNGKCRLYWLIDAGVLIGFSGILLTGLVISSWLSLPLGNYAALAGLHEAISILTLALVVLKIAVHWRWVVRTARQMFEPSAPPALGRMALQPRAVSLHTRRGDFLKLMGVVSAAAVVALINVKEPARETGAQTTVGELPDPQVVREKSSTASQMVEQTAETTETAAATVPESAATAGPAAGPAVEPTAVQTAAPSAADLSLPLESSSAACIIRCRKGRHCAYPGDCRDYCDYNSNGLCDNGECA